MPYQLLLLYISKSIGEDGLWYKSVATCGGTLINLKYAISAYHCFNKKEIREDLSKYSVWAGKYRYSSTSFQKGEQVGEYYVLIFRDLTSTK